MAKFRVRELAEERGLNILRLERLTGLARTTIRRYWHNDAQQFQMDALVKLADALKVEPGELIVRQTPEEIAAAEARAKEAKPKEETPME